MSNTLTALDDMKSRAKAGDLDALQELRKRGFFRDKKDGKEGYAVSHAQKRLWVLEQMSDESAVYNIPGALLLEGPLNQDAFRTSIEALVQRHESLRTTFVNFNGEPRQIIHDDIKFQVEEIDFSSKPERQGWVRKYAYEEAVKPFDLINGPLIRAKLLKLSEDRRLFLYNFHHTICDEWSIGVMIREVMTFYKAFSKGNDNPLPPLKIQYKDYASWQNALLESGEAEPHRGYWHRKLSGNLQVLNLPTDYPRPPILTFSGKYISFNLLNNSLFENLTNLGRESGASLFMLLTALVKVLLFRYTREKDIIIGIPIAGRNHPDLENQIGFYVNTLALRDELAGTDSFARILEKVKQTVGESYEHDIYPFDLLVTELEVNRDMSHSPMFDVMVVLRNIEYDEFRLDDIMISTFDSGFGVAKFDIIYDFVETEKGLDVTIKYNTDLFKEERIHDMVGHLRQLAISILDDVNKPIMNLEMLPESERKRLLVSFNNTEGDYTKERTIVDLFEEQVKKTPNNIAVFYEDEENVQTKKLTYYELNKRANKIAHYLRRKHTIQPDDIVGVLLNRSTDLVVGILGIMKAGGAFVLIEPDTPAERIYFILNDCNARLLLTENSTLTEGEQIPLDLLMLDMVPDTEIEANPETIVAPHNRVYAIYTSGTTGMPKGIAIGHSSLVNYTTWIAETFNFTHADSSTWHASISFDGGYACLWGMILHGGALHIISEESRKDPEKMTGYLVRHNISFLKITPSFFSILLNKERTGESSSVLADAKGLRVIHIGGEEIIPADVESFVRLGMNTQVINHYGPAEATIGSITYHIKPAHIDKFVKQPVIGKPILNTAIYILDEYGNQVPIGVFGELHIAGACLAHGYINRPDLTKEKFISNPFDDTRFGSRLYKTGDIGRWLTDGSIEFKGRNDHQVKIRGFRIELGEIENQLLKFDGVQDAIVIAKSLNGEGKELLAYVARKGNLHAGDLRNYLKKRLPDYMIPSFFIQLDNIPLTSNGKVNRNALPDPADRKMELGGKYIAPRDELERKLAKIWQEVLKTERIGIHDNFFELGGHSLKATVLVSKIQGGLDLKIGLRDVFRFPTISGLADIMRQMKPTAFVPIEPVPEADYYQVSNAQRRLWVLYQMEKDSFEYNITGNYLFEGDLNIIAFKNAYKSLIHRHESLRTTFIPIQAQVWQKIHPEIDFDIEELDFTNETQWYTEAMEYARRAATKPFDLSNGPLLRAKLLKIEAHKYIFISAVHHIISDRWSFEILIKEVLHLYNAYSTHGDVKLRPLRIQYKDYAAWQNSLLEGDDVNELKKYWHNKLSAPLPILKLPTDYARPSVKTINGEALTFIINTDLAEELRKLGRENNASLFMIFASLVKILLYRYTAQEDIIIGTGIAGRCHPDLDDQIGFYVNLLALRDKIKGDDTFSDVLDRVKRTTTEAYDHQLYPFDILVEELCLERDISRSPLFDVVLDFNEGEEIEIGLKDLNIKVLNGISVVSKYDISFLFSKRTDKIILLAEYNIDLFRRETINMMFEHLKYIIESIINNPDVKLFEIELVKKTPVKEEVEISTKFNF